MEHITENARETKELGKKFAASLKGGEVIALTGNLGSGKTTFVQGLAEGLGIKDRIISPTFILMRQHQGKRLTLYHIDLYRLEEDVKGEFRNLGVEDSWGKEGNVVVVEWAEKVKDMLPSETKWVRFKNEGAEKRRIIL